MLEGRSIGPDIAIVGAARSGTSFLSATLGRHPAIDQGSVKEPNYFSSRWSDGQEWYDGLYGPRSAEIMRLDSSVSYTYPQHPRALERLSSAVPSARIIYGVRHPIHRLVSHYQLFRYYARSDDRTSLREAIEKSAMILETSNYGFWLAQISSYFPPEQVLVIPFPLMTKNVDAALDTVLPWLGLPRTTSISDHQTESYRNEVRQFRSGRLQRMHEKVNRSRLYPKIRSIVGPDRLRTLRNAVTRPMAVPSVEQEFATLTAAQRDRVSQLAQSADDAVRQWLQEQDARHDLDWSSVWSAHSRASR